MKQDVRLYINDRLVEFTQPFDIFYNFKTTDLTSPTAIKNSFTRKIQLDDTQINNDIFSNLWNIEKVTNTIKNNFNPNKKVPFTLFVNNEIYEKGYVKLNAIKKLNSRYKYDITLYGGLGQFFSELNFKDEKNKTLADMVYTDERGNKLDLGFPINKETVFDAWNTIIGNPNGVYSNANRPETYLYNSKWETINFMVGYEGIPDNNFSPNRVLINSKDYPEITNEFSSTYKDVNGFVMGTINEDITMNMAQDYRSYLLRPVLSFKSFLRACQNPINNNGWEFVLDSTFFNKNNPYYDDAFLTLNRLIDNETEEVEGENITGTLDKDGTDYVVNFSEQDLYKYTNAKIEVTLNLNADSDAEALFTTYYYSNNAKKPKYKNYIYNNAYLIQAVAYNEYDELVAATNTHYISSEVIAPTVSKEKYFNSYREKWESTGLPTNEVVYNTGKFIKKSNVYQWVNDDNTNVFVFEFPNDVKFNKVVIRTLNCNTTATYTKRWYVAGGYEYNTKINYNTNELFYVYNTVSNTNKNITINEINALGEKTSGTTSLELIKLNLIRTKYKNFFSNTYINTKDYLTTEKTPADYLIGYAKMFGLYFYTNPKEIPSDTNKYPKGVIHLLTRESYYKLNNVVDLTSTVDKGRNIEITPCVFDNKYYTFEVPQVESEVELEYKKKYGKSYGLKTYETDFEFNADTKNLLENTPYKSAIDVLEIDKYFTQRDENNLPAYYFNGFKFETYLRENNEFKVNEMDVPVVKKTLPFINNLDIKFGDSFPKVQLHANSNDGLDDCNNIFVFFNGSSLIDENNTPYYITDDIDEMYELNDETPSYILTNSETDVNGNYIAYKMIEIPKFNRTKVDYNGNILYSFDMGETKMTYVKDNFITDNMSITANVWDSYINDLKNENNRKINCFLNLNEQATPELLRNIYWYENSFWVLNEVSNWNVNKIEPTNCELVKVIDRNNYKVNTIYYKPKIMFKIMGLEPTKIVEDKETNIVHYYYDISKDYLNLNVIIYCEDNIFEWWFNDYFYRRNIEDGLTYEEPFDYYTDAPQYNVGSMRPKIKLPYNEYKQIFDFTINVEDGTRYITHIETDGKMHN